MSFGTISATGKRGFSHHSKDPMKNEELRLTKELSDVHFYSHRTTGWEGTLRCLTAIRSRLLAAVRSGQLLFMALYLEACVLFRKIHARQRMDTKPNPGLEAVYLYCSNSVA